MAAIWDSWSFVCNFSFLRFELFPDTFATLDFPCILKIVIKFNLGMQTIGKILTFVCYRGLIVLPVNALKGYQPIILSKSWGLGTQVFIGGHWKLQDSLSVFWITLGNLVYLFGTYTFGLISVHQIFGRVAKFINFL